MLNTLAGNEYLLSRGSDVFSGIAADEATPFRWFHNLRIVALGNELRNSS